MTEHGSETAVVPRGAAIADGAVLVLLVLAVAIVATGGFRGRVFGVVLSASSPDRALILAAVVAAARHILWRTPSLPARLWHGLSRIPGQANHIAVALRPSLKAAGRSATELWMVALLMAALTAIMLPAQVRDWYATASHYDALFSLWRLAWVAHQLARDPLHLYDANIFWPEHSTLALSDGMPLMGAVAAPLLWLGAPLPIVYNVLLLASFLLSGVAMFGLVRSMTGRALPAVVSAVAFAFYPFRFEHYTHLELLTAFWMPVAVWALHRAVERTQRWRTGALLGAALAGQYLSSMYFGMFLAVYLAVVAGWLLLARKNARQSLAPILAGGLTATVLIAPTLPPYFHARQMAGERRPDEVRSFSARASDYLAIRQADTRKGDVNERQVFPGILVVILALFAFVPPVPRDAWPHLLGLFVVFDLSLGSTGFLQPLLYDWLVPFRGLRAPARASMLVGLALCILAGHGATRVLALIGRPAARLACAALACLVILAEPRPSVALARVPPIHPVYAWFNGREPAVIAELPMWYPIGARYMLNSTSHWQRLVQGFSGAVPDSYRILHHAVQSFPSDDAIRRLRERGAQYVVVHEEFYGAVDYHSIVALLEQEPHVVFVSRATDGRFESRIYRIIGGRNSEGRDD